MSDPAMAEAGTECHHPALHLGEGLSPSNKEQAMNRVIRACLVALIAGFVAVSAGAQNKGEGKMSVVPQTPEWQKLKSLVGQWEGFVEADGKQVPATVEVRMTGDGSAIMHLMGKDTPHEMVTMIHPDGKRLLATHYCAEHNQPRMALVPAKAPNQAAFQFVDGTNIGPGEAYMTGVVFTFVDADHHEEAWTSSTGPGAAVFKFTRKK
jgi:hypothetical protein